jgi:hypothetical protein
MPAPHAADLVTHFDFPRESAAALRAGADTLAAMLGRSDLTPQFTWVISHPDRMIAAALVWGAAAIALCAVHRRSRVHRAAITMAGAVLGIAAASGALDTLLPARRTAQLEIVIAPREAVEREVILGAHYDSKTELFDHAGRTVAFALAAALAILGLGGRRVRVALPAAFLLAAVTAGGGRFAVSRSHGIADNAAACAMLIEVASELQAMPLAATRVRCVWWSEEEAGAQGSRAWTRVARLDSLPRWALNLECIGAGSRLAYARREWAGTRWYTAPAPLVQRLQSAAGPSLGAIALPVVTDAGSLRHAGIAAVTLVGMEDDGGPPRHMHGRGDRLAALDHRGLDAARTCVRRFLAGVDAPD